jgi:hypothetical protein
MKLLSFSLCNSCGATKIPHRACQDCGFYDGRKVTDNSRKAARLLRKTSVATAKHSDKTEADAKK